MVEKTFSVLAHEIGDIKSIVSKKKIRIYFPSNTKYKFWYMPKKKKKKYGETFILQSLVTRGQPNKLYSREIH